MQEIAGLTLTRYDKEGPGRVERGDQCNDLLGSEPKTPNLKCSPAATLVHDQWVDDVGFEAY